MVLGEREEEDREEGDKREVVDKMEEEEGRVDQELDQGRVDQDLVSRRRIWPIEALVDHRRSWCLSTPLHSHEISSLLLDNRQKSSQ